MLESMNTLGNETLKGFITRLSHKQGLWSSGWFASPSMEVFVRAGDQYNRALGIHKSVVIANVHVYQKERRKGVFKTFLDEVETLAITLNCQSVRVECVGNELLRDYLLRVGYIIEDREELAPTLYLPL